MSNKISTKRKIIFAVLGLALILIKGNSNRELNSFFDM